METPGRERVDCRIVRQIDSTSRPFLAPVRAAGCADMFIDALPLTRRIRDF